MKKLLFVAATFAFVCITQAQEKTSASNVVTRGEVTTNLDRTAENLKLTDAQKAQIVEINKKYTAKKEAIRETGTIEDFKALSAEKQKEIRAVLHSEQAEQMDRQQIQQEKDIKANEFKKSAK